MSGVSLHADAGNGATVTETEEIWMSAYTRRNLEDVKDSAPQFGFGEVQEAHFASGDLETEQTGVSFHRVKPGKRQGFAHRHDEAEEVYVVIGGSGRVKLDDDIVDLERLDAVRLAPGVTRQFEGGPEGIEILVFGARHEGDGETINDWWTE
jgi:mannose-6-phosphate isomerase-like protein (cupin superfamily)